jgi:hypothetical protein
LQPPQEGRGWGRVLRCHHVVCRWQETLELGEAVREVGDVLRLLWFVCWLLVGVREVSFV